MNRCIAVILFCSSFSNVTTIAQEQLPAEQVVEVAPTTVPDALPAVLDLPTAQAIALRDNPSLQASAARIEQAMARIKQARADYFPQIGLSYSASVTELSNNDYDAAKDAASAASLGQLFSLIGALPPLDLDTAGQIAGLLIQIDRARDGVDDTDENYRASLAMTWTIFDGFSRKFRNLAARVGAQQVEAAYDEARRLLLSAVARAYHGVQLARENIAIAEADRGFNDRQLREAEARRRVGTGSLSDVLNFQVRVKAAQSSQILSESTYRIALIALAELMGLADALPPDTMEVAELHSETPEEMVAPEIMGLLEFAATHRPDLEQSYLALESADALVGIERGAYWPRIDAFASRDAFRSRNGFFAGDDFSATAGVSLSYDIYAGGRRKGALQEARAFKSEVERLADDAELAVSSDVRQSLVSLETAQKELVVQRETTGYVERNRDLVEREYRAGQGSLVRLNEAQRDLIAQQSRLALSRVALRQSWHDLRTATAETLEAFVATE